MKLVKILWLPPGVRTVPIWQKFENEMNYISSDIKLFQQRNGFLFDN